MAIRNVIGKYLPLPPDPVPKNNTKKAYGTVQLTFVSFIQMKRMRNLCFVILQKQSLLSYIKTNSPHCETSTYPKAFEALGQVFIFYLLKTRTFIYVDKQNQAFVVYSTVLSDPEVQGKVLDLSGVHDYAYVLLGEVN